jgi:ribonuclease J
VLDIPPFKVETFHVCHSIPDCVGVGIQTPHGLIVHTGDFKFDQTPVDNWPTDYARLASFSERSPLLLLSDSTNADRAGWTPSERVIDAAFDGVFRKAKGRIIVATFASLISRVQQVANAAQRYGRKMAIMGHSMSDNIRMATALGYLELPPELLVNMDEAMRLPHDQIVFMATGTQGEPTAVLNRIAGGRHKNLALHPDDTIVMSAHPIPGNEEAVYRIINRLLARGATVIYDSIAPVHVSGHASQEEQKLMLSLVRPRYFIPIHGERRHLQMHAALAEQVGIPRENIAIIENGVIVEFDESGNMTVGARYPGGYVFVDGATVGDISLELLREREHLSRDGVVIVSVAVRAADKSLCAPPQITTRGFVLQRDMEMFLTQIRDAIAHSLQTAAPIETPAEPPEITLEDRLRGDIERAIHVATRRRPQVFVSVLQV